MEELIRVKNLTKSYNNSIVVNNLNISIRKGEIFGLLGANGARKSTSIECILGTRIADKGSIVFIILSLKLFRWE